MILRLCYALYLHLVSLGGPGTVRGLAPQRLQHTRLLDKKRCLMSKRASVQYWYLTSVSAPSWTAIPSRCNVVAQREADGH